MTSEAIKRQRAKVKARREREAKELARLRKELGDFVKKHLAAGTAAGSGYEKAVKKRQNAIDEYYAGTRAGYAAAREQQQKKDAAAESVKLETQITELRDDSRRLSRKKRGELEDLEKQLAKKRKKARGGLKKNEAKAAKTRAEATSALAKVRRELRKAVREGRAEDVAKLEKDLTKAERQLAKLDAVAPTRRLQYDVATR